MDFYERKLKLEIEKSKAAAAEKSAREYESKLSQQYLDHSNHSSTVIFDQVEEKELSRVTMSSKYEEEPTSFDVSTRPSLDLPEKMATTAPATTLKLATTESYKELYEKKVKEEEDRIREREAEAEYKRDMAKWAMMAKVDPSLVSTKTMDLTSGGPYLATRDAGPNIGFKLTSTDRGTELTLGLSTWEGVAGLLAIMGTGILVTPVLTISINFLFKIFENCILFDQRGPRDGHVRGAGVLLQVCGQKMQSLLLSE